jgi:hypothetical protein
VRKRVPTDRNCGSMSTDRDTLIGWARARDVAYTGEAGRPRTAEKIRDLILRLARETGWGYARISPKGTLLVTSLARRAHARAVVSFVNPPVAVPRQGPPALAPETQPVIVTNSHFRCRISGHGRGCHGAEFAPVLIATCSESRHGPCFVEVRMLYYPQSNVEATPATDAK